MRLFYFTELHKNNNCLMSLKLNSCNSVGYKHGAAAKTDLYFILFYFIILQHKPNVESIFSLGGFSNRLLFDPLL